MKTNNSICPWWMGYFLVNPLRKIVHDPEKITGTYMSWRNSCLTEQMQLTVFHA